MLATFALFSVPVIVTLEAYMAKAMLKGAKGQGYGLRLDLLHTPSGGLTLLFPLIDVPTGEHAFHIHAVGECEPPGFDLAGGHFNPANARHGMMSGRGHDGDMPNLHVLVSSALDLEVLNALITLDKDKPKSAFFMPEAL